jgi:hypothetical protein
VWSVGDEIVVRYVEGGRAVSGLPVRILESSQERLVLYLAQGTLVDWPAVAGRTIRDASLRGRFTTAWGHLPHVWKDGSLLFVFPRERSYGLWLFFGAAGAFKGEWYVNLQTPFQPTPIGIDTRDHTLDLWVAEDGSHRWKDEDELEAAVRAGTPSPRRSRARNSGSDPGRCLERTAVERISRSWHKGQGRRVDA